MTIFILSLIQTVYVLPPVIDVKHRHKVFYTFQFYLTRKILRES